MGFVRRFIFRIAGFLYRRAFFLYWPLYSLYKAVTERHDRAVASSHIHPGGVVVDVGANIGSFTRFAARRVGPRGRVFAFEPSGENYEHLVALTANCPPVEPVHAALADYVGSITLHVSEEMNVDHQTYDSGERRAEVEVPCFSLDDWLTVGSVDFIKIDVQGYEFEVVSGMRRILSENPDLAVAFEYWPAGLRRAGREPSRLLELFTDMGFEVRFSHGRQWTTVLPELGAGVLDYVTAVARR